jgi:nitrous oxidase accessory protein NosD
MLSLGLIAAASIAGLTPGATIRLPEGMHPKLSIEGERFDPPVIIDGTGTTINGVVIMDSEGIVLRGATVMAPKGRNGVGPTAWGVHARRVKNVVFENLEITNVFTGVVIANSDGVTVRGSRFHGMRSDGINLAGVTNILIEDNDFRDFTPIKPKGSRKDGTWVDGDHPDAIQLWTTKKRDYGRDIVIRRNTIDGDTQGINLFGPQGQGYERVRILDNDLHITYPNAVSMFRCTDCEVVGNKARAKPNAYYPMNIRAENSTGRFCGNNTFNHMRIPTRKPC